MNQNVKQALWVLLLVFVSAAGVQFLANVTDIFATDLATWKIVVNSGVMAVVSYVLMWVAPRVPIGRSS